MMSLLKLKAIPCILIADDANKNNIPLLLELVSEKSPINLFSYEQPVEVWEKVFPNRNLHCYEEYDPQSYNKYFNNKSTVIVDSVNQMSLDLGWYECYKLIKQLSKNSRIEKLILILHKDCLPHSSKLHTYLDHLVNATISYVSNNPCKIFLKIKKGNKVIKSEEILSYDRTTNTLKCTPILKEEITNEEPEKTISPAKLASFKIEVDQIDKMEKSKLKLPYMNKIREGESKVIYEPDAVDDWDEEDPDEDLDI